MATETEDVENSVAYSLLDDLVTQGKLSEDEAHDLKSRYALLSGAVHASHERERTMLKRARALNNEILNEKIAMEKAKVRQSEDVQRVRKLEEERKRAKETMAAAEESDTMVKFELTETEKRRTELAQQVEDMKEENRQLVEPVLAGLREEIQSYQSELSKQEEAFERDSKRKREMLARSEQLQADRADKEATLASSQNKLAKVSAEPARVQRQAESVRKAADVLQVDIDNNEATAAELVAQIEERAKKKTEADEVKKNLQHKLQLHRETIEARQSDLETVNRNLDMERVRHHDLVTRRLELQLKRKQLETDVRHGADSVNLSNKELDMLKRSLKKKTGIADAAREVLPTLESQLHDAQHSLRTYQEENAKQNQNIDSLKQEVDMMIARFLQQEGVETGRRQELEAIVAEVEAVETEVQEWTTEHRKQAKLVSVLSTQRDIKAREAQRSMVNEKETKRQVKVKELVILELTKRCNEVNNRLKEFSALYDVLKNERNKYVNLIQSSNQALAEMAEKLKILGNELSILRNESQSKDKALAKEKNMHVQAQVHRDQLRLETNRCHTEYRKKQSVVEQQIQEIDKLNSVISALENDMLDLKTRYEKAVEERNATGVQLIDRNDELCILYEKANTQEETLRKGEVVLRQKDEDSRVLKIQIADRNRHAEAMRRQVPEVQHLSESISRLEHELELARRAAEELCRQLEDTSNDQRSRPLEGDDPDPETINAKIVVLEERLNGKREELLEKELILEEVSALTEKLRSQARDKRDRTVDLARRVNEYQARIRDVTKKMMSTVAELSMYQATALKLQQEKELRVTEIEEAEWKMEHGDAPSEEAIKDWNRIERKRHAAEEARMRREEEAATSQAFQDVQTTADARPNAYIPDELGIPKPYGNFAPFKPSELGSTARHIQPVQKTAIQI